MYLNLVLKKDSLDLSSFINILFCSDFVQPGVSQGSSQAGSPCLYGDALCGVSGGGSTGRL